MMHIDEAHWINVQFNSYVKNAPLVHKFMTASNFNKKYGDKLDVRYFSNGSPVGWLLL